MVDGPSSEARAEAEGITRQTRYPCTGRRAPPHFHHTFSRIPFRIGWLTLRIAAVSHSRGRVPRSVGLSSPVLLFEARASRASFLTVCPSRISLTVGPLGSALRASPAVQAWLVSVGCARQRGRPGFHDVFFVFQRVLPDGRIVSRGDRRLSQTVQ